MSVTFTTEQLNTLIADTVTAALLSNKSTANTYTEKEAGQTVPGTRC